MSVSKKSKPKDLTFAYFLLLISGAFGFHQIYLGRYLRALILPATLGVSYSSFVFFRNESWWFNTLPLAYIGVAVWIWDVLTLRWQVAKIYKALSGERLE